MSQLRAEDIATIVIVITIVVATYLFITRRMAHAFVPAGVIPGHDKVDVAVRFVRDNKTWDPFMRGPNDASEEALMQKWIKASRAARFNPNRVNRFRFEKLTRDCVRLGLLKFERADKERS